MWSIQMLASLYLTLVTLLDVLLNVSFHARPEIALLDPFLGLQNAIMKGQKGPVTLTGSADKEGRRPLGSFVCSF